MKTEISEQATRVEDEGRYSKAVELYLCSAASRISTLLDEADADPSFVALATADLLRAEYCALRANEPDTAANVALVLEGITPIVADRTENVDLDRVLQELLGDSKLLLRAPEAATHYDAALETYRKRSDTEQLSTGMEPEFVHAQWVIEDFLEWKGIPYPAETATAEPVTTDFVGRIERKQSLAGRLSGDG